MLLPTLRSALEAKRAGESELREMATVDSKIPTDRLCPSLMCIQEPSLVARRITSSHGVGVFSASINSASQEIHCKTTTGPKAFVVAQKPQKALSE
jgi:hypothetical protein